jgi:hypothetical protein
MLPQGLHKVNWGFFLTGSRNSELTKWPYAARFHINKEAKIPKQQGNIFF